CAERPALGRPYSAPATASASAESRALITSCSRLRIRSGDASARASPSRPEGSTMWGAVIVMTPFGACQMVCVSRTERNGTIMTMTNEKQQHDDGPSGQDLVEQLKASGQLDALFEQIDAGQVELTGDGGFVPALVKAALERGLQAELTSHLGYEKGS